MCYLFIHIELSLRRHAYQEREKYHIYIYIYIYIHALFSSLFILYRASNLRSLKCHLVSPSLQSVLHLLCLIRNFVLNFVNEEMECLSMIRLRVVQSTRNFCKQPIPNPQRS